ATQEGSSNLRVVDILGTRNDTSHDIWDIKIQMELSAGGQPVDLTQLVLRYSNGTTVRNYIFGGANSYTLNWIRGAGTNNVIDSGDLVELNFNSTSGELAPRTAFEVQLIPEVGSPV